jgi:hypothetical protein
MSDTEIDFFLACCTTCGCGRLNHYGDWGRCLNCGLCAAFTPFTDKDFQVGYEIHRRRVEARVKELQAKGIDIQMGL